MKGIIFTDESNFNSVEAFIAILQKGICTKDELLDELNKKMGFPEYFGFNWDALSDCLNDFHWVNKKDIYLVHLDLPILNNNDTKIYLQILNDAIKSWQISTVHTLKVIFPKVVEIKVNEYLK